MKAIVKALCIGILFFSGWCAFDIYRNKPIDYTINIICGLIGFAIFYLSLFSKQRK